MAIDDTSRIETTHIGSLPRPPELLDLLRTRQSGGDVDPDEWERVSSEATDDIVDRQLATGIDEINNGEQPRVSFNYYVGERLTNIGGQREQALWADLEEYPAVAEDTFETDVIDLASQPAVTGEIRYDGYDEAEREIEQFHDALEGTDVDIEDTFFTTASPSVVAATHVDEHYGDHEEYVSAIADAMAEEYQLYADTGATIQIDAPDLLATGHSHLFADNSVEEFRGIVEMHVDALNEALSGIPEEQVRLHTCWGSYEGPHHLDTDLADMLPTLYEADISGLSVEQANPRHQHEYRAFAEHPLPDGWTLIPGVVDVKTNIIDHPETIADRIERVANTVPDDTKIVAAPDCGFGTQAGLGMVHPDIAWPKLEALVEGAEIASERLD
ncbi:cobalamin-independent methionine synthase II family protein [Halolamina salifodinae]|uniref:5-methyltetrahydropteroyltriglutamate--homocysteine methyltransferase n=1 Tax=Halolamina salifodinae TaxID=1202767 RepID=A0A8T4GYT7_9EURY|nr:cobalamin-independent methionine synthase II family protein [Halolamina salifodinae]MBP1986535.1 5-methyltetrahydropteroyltriglutamate--homocysteine methyltransferase [Halolamina salifodinae]